MPDNTVDNNMSNTYTNELLKDFKSAPPDNTVKPPALPPRPDLFDEVEWAPFVTPGDAKLARRVWDLPNSILGNAIVADGPFPRPNTEAEAEAQDMHALANNVYEHLMQSHLRPPSEDNWEEKWRDTMLSDKTWSMQTIFAPIQELQSQGSDELILVNGQDVLTAPWWTMPRLREELRNRELSDSGRSIDLRRRLYDNEREMRGYSHLPRSDLSYWGLTRTDNNFTFRLSETDVLKPLDMYTWAILISPYNPAYWLSRAYCHYQQAFFDLAIGDAHRAQLLCEVLVDPRERNRQPGLYPRIWHATEQHLLAWPRDMRNGRLLPETERLRGPNGINYFIPTLRKALHNIISLSLSALGSWHDYYTMERYLQQRVIMPYRDATAFERRERVLYDVVVDYQGRRNQERLFFNEKRAGNVNGAREYPYEADDKDRAGNVPVNVMNHNLFKDFPKCEVRANIEDNSLSVVATQEVEKDTLIFAEEPSMRGHLNVIRLPADKTQSNAQNSRCENCRKLLSKDVLKRYWNEAKAVLNDTHPEACKCTLQRGYEPMHFCPANDHQGPTTTCMQIARELYHHRACGKNWKWLHDAMRPGINYWTPSHKNPDNAKDPIYGRPGMSYFAYTNEAHGTTLSLLLRDVFDTTLLRRERTGDANLMAHEIDELFMLEDPKSWSGSWFPFTLAGNIRVPFDILLQLGVDIFRDLTFDTWVIQIVLRKLLVNAVPWDEKWRGTVEHVEQNKTPPKISEQKVMLHDRKTFEKIDPSFHALYLFPGFSLFNHACRGRHNALWGYDETIPNRMLVWATEDIPKSTEIRIPYKSKPMSRDSAQRILGRGCQCSLCRDGEVVNESGSEDDSDDYEGYSDDSNDPDYVDDGDDNANRENNHGNATANGNTNPNHNHNTQNDNNSPIPNLLHEGTSSTQPQPPAHELLSNPYVPAPVQNPNPNPNPNPVFANPHLNLHPYTNPNPHQNSRSESPSPSPPTDRFAWPVTRQMAHKTALGPRGRTYHPSVLSVDDAGADGDFDGDTEAQWSSGPSTEEMSSTEELSSSVYDETNQQFLIRGLAEKRKAKAEEQENRQENQQEQQKEEEEEGEGVSTRAMDRENTPPGKKRKRSGGMDEVLSCCGVYL